MQFLVCGYDGTDDEALERRLRVRGEHIALGDKLAASGNMLIGVALLDGDDQMIGSALVVDFPTREALDEWLEIEPYVVGDVWQRIEISPCRVGPSFRRGERLEALAPAVSGSAETTGFGGISGSLGRLRRGWRRCLSRRAVLVRRRARGTMGPQTRRRSDRLRGERTDLD